MQRVSKVILAYKFEVLDIDTPNFELINTFDELLIFKKVVLPELFELISISP